MNSIGSIAAAREQRRETPESLAARGYANLLDPDCIMPQVCSVCRKSSSFFNPLRLEPCGTMRDMAHGYMHRAVGACCSRH